MLSPVLDAQFQSKAKDLGFSSLGWTSLKTPLSLAFYKSWLEQGFHGEMEYLERHLPQKENPASLGEKLRSALVLTFPYLPHPKADLRLKQARTALYAQGEDYHYWLKEKLQHMISELKKFYPEEEFLAFTDSSPVLERDLAYQSGLGWIGKNTCLIHPQRGSLFLIGEIYSSVDVSPLNASPSPDFCGKCNACVEICPTGALLESKKLDARKCISYLTIESRQIPPPELRSSIGDWFFGCDLCQTVCPWNEKVFRGMLQASSQHSPSSSLSEPLPPSTADSQSLASGNIEKSLEQSSARDFPRGSSIQGALEQRNEKKKTLDKVSRQELIEDLRFILTSSGKQLEKHFFGTALSRAGSFGLRRNAMIVAANQNLQELREDIYFWKKDERLSELVDWALESLT